MHISRRGTFGGLAADSYGTPGDRAPLVLLHGLSFDRRQWNPVVEELATFVPDWQVIAFDLPGHGNSPRQDSYRVADVTAALHRAVTEAGLGAPILVGHSLGGVLATAYAGAYPAAGVVNVDQPLLAGPFGQMLRGAEGELRGPAWRQVWDRLLAGMQIELLPPRAQELVRATTEPRQDLLLGYWSELLDTPGDLIADQRVRDLETIRRQDVAYHHVTGEELPDAYRKWLAALLPDAAVTVLPGSGHFPHLARPDRLARILAG